MLKLDADYARSAEAARLRYVSDSDAGISRTASGKDWTYTLGGTEIKDEATLERIRTLAIPPAWTQVWICKWSNGHIQATGYDARGRKQYRYHTEWNSLRNETKFHRIYEFGKRLLALRQQIETDFAAPGLTQAKVIATVLSLMQRTYIRIGSAEYAKENGSYGLTTLKDSHVQVQGSNLRLSFRGKKGIDHDISLRHPRLAKAVKACRDIPGKELFQYYDEEGKRRPIDSGMVNNYIREATGADYTAKDFRTWAGTLQMLCALAESAKDENQDSKQRVNAALEVVSKHLGNTRTVCKKYYVHPGIISLYETDGLAQYFKELDAIEQPDDLTGYTSQEKVLMKVLAKLV